MTIYIPTWLYWYGVPPLVFALGYLLGWTRGREVPPDPYRRGELPGVEPTWYPPTPPGSTEVPTTKRARPTNPRPPRDIDSAWDEDKS